MNKYKIPKRIATKNYGVDSNGNQMRSILKRESNVPKFPKLPKACKRWRTLMGIDHPFRQTTNNTRVHSYINMTEAKYTTTYHFFIKNIGIHQLYI